MKHGHFNQGLELARIDFVVPVQASAVGQPGKGALDDPVLGQYSFSAAAMRSQTIESQNEDS